MAQERRNPLPVGRYWLSVQSTAQFPDRLDHFRQWTASNASRVTVEHSEADGASSFFIFRVTKPITFDQKQFGFPNTAGDDVQRAADTSQRPPVPTPLGTLQDALSSALDTLTASGTGRLLLIGGLLWLASKGKK